MNDKRCFPYTLVRVALLSALFAAGYSVNPVWAQDEEQSSQPPQAEDVPEKSNEEQVIQDTDVDDDDTFVPSEEVSSDSSISFPVDI